MSIGNEIAARLAASIVVGVNANSEHRWRDGITDEQVRAELMAAAAKLQDSANITSKPAKAGE